MIIQGQGGKSQWRHIEGGCIYSLQFLEKVIKKTNTLKSSHTILPRLEIINKGMVSVKKRILFDE